MLVYRVGKSRWAGDLSGEGAKRNGGRWNHKGMPCLYTSESRALAVLEYTVNVGIDEIPRALSLTTIEIPDKKILDIGLASLPGNWRESPAPASTRDFGAQFFEKHLILKLPSSVLPEEYNYLINPLHQDSLQIKIIDVRDFVYDLRIKAN